MLLLYLVLTAVLSAVSAPSPCVPFLSRRVILGRGPAEGVVDNTLHLRSGTEA